MRTTVVGWGERWAVLAMIDRQKVSRWSICMVLSTARATRLGVIEELFVIEVSTKESEEHDRDR